MQKRGSFSTVQVRKETKDLLRAYCGLTNTKISDFLSNIIDGELAEFKKTLEEIRRIGYI